MHYLHPDNKDKEFVDWRKPENRKEGFMRWLYWRMKYKDLDHYAVNNAYRDDWKMDKEQQYWFCTIFGMTYQSEMAWVIFNKFPNFEEIDVKELDTWNRASMPIMKYARDTKYNKGHIVAQYESIKKAVEPFGTLTEYYESKVIAGNEQRTFEILFDAVCNDFHKYGRMTAWITLQCLFETAGLPCRPNTMLSYHESNWSVRSGLMYLYGRDDRIEATDKTVVMTVDEIEWLKKTEVELYDESVAYLDGEFTDMFSNYVLESQLCQYKKLMIGGDYAGHSSGDHVSRANWLSERWPDVEFQAFYKDVMASQYYPRLRGLEENKILRKLTARTGQMINLHDDFPDMPNMYLELAIDKFMMNNSPAANKVLQTALDGYVQYIENGEDIITL